MIVYEEVVQLRRFMSPVREIFILATVPAFAGYLYWSEIRGTNILSHPASSIGLVTFLAFEILPTLMILNAALFPEVCVRINEEALILKRGFFRKGIPLDLIIEVHPVAASRVNRTTVREKLYQSSDFLFLDRRDSQNVELLLSGGRTSYFATPRAEEVAGILLREATRSQRESALRLIAAHQPKPL